MNEVDKAIDSVEQHDLYGQREVPIAHARALTAEVRRLRAILEPTPDVRELESLFCKVNRVTAYHRHGQAIPKSALDDLANAQIDSERCIAARDAEIRRDAFEAGYAQGHNDTVEGCTRDMHDAANDYIAAIIGKEE